MKNKRRNKKQIFILCPNAFKQIEHGLIYEKVLDVPESRVWFVDKYGHHLTLGRSGGQTVDTRSIIRRPLKTLGYNGSNYLLGRSVASRLWVHEPDTFFGGTDKEFREKLNFFIYCSVPENFQMENFSGQVPTESLRTQGSENVYERGPKIRSFFSKIG